MQIRAITRRDAQGLMRLKLALARETDTMMLEADERSDTVHSTRHEIRDLKNQDLCSSVHLTKVHSSAISVPSGESIGKSATAHTLQSAFCLLISSRASEQISFGNSMCGQRKTTSHDWS